VDTQDVTGNRTNTKPAVTLQDEMKEISQRP
jgi:hypothetical protein